MIDMEINNICRNKWNYNVAGYEEADRLAKQTILFKALALSHNIITNCDSCKIEGRLLCIQAHIQIFVFIKQW